jgi:imidazole glycerol-phosphate synthase subunit HisF
VDVKKDIFGRYVCFSHSGKKKIKTPLLDYIISIENSGAGELFLTSVDNEGTFSGYDLDLLNFVSQHIKIPVVANGGASKLDDFADADIKGGASGVAAGSLFVYKSENRGVLINYPSQIDLKEKVFFKID